jgi:hypothetical protein
LNGSLQIGNGEQLNSAYLHAVNLRHYLCDFVDAGVVKKRESMVLKSEGWEIAVEPVTDLDQLKKQLDIAGGYAITHLFRVKRADGSTFTAAQLEELNGILFLLLSFAEGRTVNAILPVGLDARQDVRWQSWMPWRISPWRSVLTWVDPHHGEAIAAAFPGFAKRWQQPSWRNAIRIAIESYAHANSNSDLLDYGVVLAVMSLDAIAWERLVLSDRTLTRKAFNKMSAAKRIAMLCVACKIPLVFPTSAPELAKAARSNKWADLTQAIVEMRNNVIHPDNRLEKRQIDMHVAIVEAWNHALWLCELAILSSIGYGGPYSDRRTISKDAGTVAKLPWAI